jgi:hypothetical protein
MRNDDRNDVTPPRDLPILDGEILTDDTCPECGGDGTIPVCWNNDPDRCEDVQCENCDGAGTVALDDTDDGVDCSVCGGTGKGGTK